MNCKMSLYILGTILFIVISKAMQSEPVDPCQSNQDKIIADMCTDDYVVEDSYYGGKDIDSVLLRITKQQNNCICHVSLQQTVTNTTIYMSKYNGLSSSAPVQQNCGLAVDVEYVDTSDIARPLPPIECTIGTSMRSIEWGDGKLLFRSRIIDGDLTKGYCMQVFKIAAVISCTMNDQVGKAGTEPNWIETSGQQHTSLDACKKYCLETAYCVAVNYEPSYCFVYNMTTILLHKDGAIYSQKECVDTQKLKIRCYPPESTTQISQETLTEDTFSTITETVTKLIGDIYVTNSNNQLIIEDDNEVIKDTSPSFLVALVIAIIGCTAAVIFAGTTLFYKRQLHTQKSKSPLVPSVNYVDLSEARDVSDYSAINTQVVNEQYETVNARI